MSNIKSFYNFLNEAKIKKSNLNDFWKMVNTIADELKLSSNFYPYWKLEETFPEMKGIKSKNSDVLVNLHNKNKVKKKTSIEERIVMFLNDWYEINKNPNINITSHENFKEWFLNGELTIYRGISDSNYKDPNLTIENDKFISTSLSMDKAKCFTQYGWANRVWVDNNKRNGWILVGKIKPCDVHIFNNEGHEFECVIKGSYTFSDKVKVEKNIILK